METEKSNQIVCKKTAEWMLFRGRQTGAFSCTDHLTAMLADDMAAIDAITEDDEIHICCYPLKGE